MIAIKKQTLKSQIVKLILKIINFKTGKWEILVVLHQKMK